jgi:hypothetical protein
MCINGDERGEQSNSNLPRICADGRLLDALFGEAKPSGAGCASTAGCGGLRLLTCGADVTIAEHNLTKND